MSRFPPLPPSTLEGEQKKCYDELEKYTHQLYGGSNLTLKNKDGAFIGPFLPLMYTPSLTVQTTELATAVISTPLLNLRERELAILASLSLNSPIFAVHAHSKLAKQAGLTQEQIIDAREGRLPKDLSERESICYDFVFHIVRTSGALDNEHFDRAKNLMGRECVAALMHLAGFYLYMGVLINGADVGLPEGETL